MEKPAVGIKADRPADSHARETERSRLLHREWNQRRVKRNDPVAKGGRNEQGFIFPGLFKGGVGTGREDHPVGCIDIGPDVDEKMLSVLSNPLDTDVGFHAHMKRLAGNLKAGEDRIGALRCRIEPAVIVPRVDPYLLKEGEQLFSGIVFKYLRGKLRVGSVVDAVERPQIGEIAAAVSGPQQLFARLFFFFENRHRRAGPRGINRRGKPGGSAADHEDG